MHRTLRLTLALFLTLTACSSDDTGTGQPNGPGNDIINDSAPGADTVVGSDSQDSSDTTSPDAVSACRGNSECPIARPVCVDGQCHVCQPDSHTCEGQTLISCAADGLTVTRQVCDQGCVNGACVSGCSPGARGCMSATDIGLCPPEGGELSYERTCPSGQVCNSGECLACFPGQRRCDFERVEVCNDAGEWVTGDNCDDDGQKCVLGTCRPACYVDPKFVSNAGCDYWAVDLDNVASAADGPFAVIVSNVDTRHEASVRITRRDGPSLASNVVYERTVAPNSLEIFNLANRNMGQTGLFWTAYRIEATRPIIAYQFNPLENVDVFSNDASLLLPSTAFAREYIVMSRAQILGSVNGFETPFRGWFSVVASQNATLVTITPSTATLAGNGVQAMNAGQSYTIPLEPYQVLNIKTASTGGDLTGTIVESSAPIGVFGGHDATTSGQVCCADHLEQQLFPVSSWGLNYIAAQSKRRQSEQDYWRILAAHDQTTIRFNPLVHAPVTLNRGQHYEFKSSADFAISADKPISVGQILASSMEILPANASGFCSVTCGSGYECSWGTCIAPSCSMTGPNTCPEGHVCAVFSGQSRCSPIGDPTLIMLPPVEQFRKDYVFLTPNKYAFDYISVVAPLDAQVELDGAILPESSFQQTSGSDWKVARLSVSDGVHRVNSSHEIGLTVYGYDRDVSYGYPAGLNLSEQ